MNRKILAALLAAAFVVMGTAGTASAKHSFKMATAAPPNSPWGKVFKTWCKAVEKKASDMECEWLWNSTAGPEEAVVGKVESGQIDGAAITAVGLSKIDKRIIALQLPGWAKNWAALDKGRDKLSKGFSEAAAKKGFHIAGWGDVGIARTFSVGFPVTGPSSLKGKSIAVLRHDIIAPKIYEVIGGVSAKPGDISSFLPMLRSKSVQVQVTPSLAAEQLQWASVHDHMLDSEVAYVIGAVVMSQKKLDKLPADDRKVMIDTGELAAKALTKKIRRYDDKSYNRLKKKMKVHKPTGAEEAEWKKVFRSACQKLKPSIPYNGLGTIGAC